MAIKCDHPESEHSIRTYKTRWNTYRYPYCKVCSRLAQQRRAAIDRGDEPENETVADERRRRFTLPAAISLKLAITPWRIEA